MKIKIWESKNPVKDMDVEFPLYSRWIVSDSADIFNRVDARGLCISISKDVGAWDENFDGPAYEIKRTKINLARPLHESYLNSFGNRVYTEAEFLAVFDEMIAAIQKTRDAIL